MSILKKRKMKTFKNLITQSHIEADFVLQLKLLKAELAISICWSFFEWDVDYKIGQLFNAYLILHFFYNAKSVHFFDKKSHYLGFQDKTT